MPYSTEIYKKAEQILEKRRDKAVMQADARAEEIKEKLPEVAEIQRRLSRIGLEISKLFFYNGDKDEKVRELRMQSEALGELHIPPTMHAAIITIALSRQKLHIFCTKDF